jgi:flagellar basal-body rod modification protein FlgD
MDISAIGTNGVLGASNKATTHGFSELGSEDFFGLMIAQLQAQDPLKPTDNQQLLAQLSSIREMEQSATLNKTLNSLAGEQRFGATAGLLGTYVGGTVKDSSGNDVEVQGVVTGVRFESDGDAILDLHNGKSLPASNVEQVTLVENLPPEILETLGDAAGTTPPAKNIFANQKAATAPVGTGFQELGRRLDIGSSVLESLLSQGVGVGI